jgi:tyrosine-protein kinase Etk/Wzc
MEPQVKPGGGGVLDSGEIKSILRIAAKNWWIFFSIIAISYAIGYYYAYTLPDVYAAQTQLLLKSNDQDNPSSLIGGSGAMGALSGFSGYMNMINTATETIVIQSHDLIRSVVEKLNINVSYFIDGRLRKTEVFGSLPFKVTPYFLNNELYEQEIRLNIIDRYHFRITYTKGDNTMSQDGAFGDDFINTDMKLHIASTGALNMNQSSIDKMKEINYLFRIHRTEYLVSTYSSAMSVTNPEYTNVLDISVKDIIPSRAIAFLDTLNNLYINNTVQTQVRINTNTLNYIDKEMGEVTDILDTIEISMEKYKEKRDILDIDKEEDDYFQSYDNLNDDKAAAQLELQALNDLEQYIIEDKDPEFLPPSVYVNTDDDFLTESTTELYSTQLKIIEAHNNNTEENPSISDAKNKIKLMKKDLLTYISNSRKAYNDKLASIDSSINSSIKDIRTIPEKERGLMNIQRQEDVNEDLYEFLLQQRATTIIAKAAIIPESRVLDEARSLGVVEPNRKKVYIAAVGIGAVIALIIIFIRLLFFDRIENIQELKAKTTLPVLGEILSAPLTGDLTFAVEDNPKSPLTESFRTLRTNLQYMASDIKSKVVLFTSNGPSEGKTFCSLNMGAILAKADKKVLVLEFDLHKPRIHKVLNMSPDVGLSTVIIGKTPVRDAIVPSPIHGLDIILCGPVPPNSSELVLSEKIKDIIQFGRENYDYVIIDTPPLGFISDALILMNHSDINLFVLNTKFAYKEAIDYVQEIVYSNKIKNFGFVLNNVKRKKSRYYYNRYGYYGGYGYGYGGYGGYGS